MSTGTVIIVVLVWTVGLLAAGWFVSGRLHVDNTPDRR